MPWSILRRLALTALVLLPPSPVFAQDIKPPAGSAERSNDDLLAVVRNGDAPAAEQAFAEIRRA